MKYKYLFSDMDGTLLDDRGCISGDNLNSIRKFIKQGGRFTVATGRSELIVKPFFRDLPTNFSAILYNGAAVYDFAAESFLYQVTLPGSIVDAIYRLALSVYPKICFEAFAGGPIWLFNRNGITDHLVEREAQPTVYREYDPGEAYIKLLLYGEEERLKKVAAAIRHLEDGNFRMVFSAPFYLEILPVNCSKGKAMSWMMEHFQIPVRETAAIGDFDNDLEMIQLASLGAAPENATDRIKHAADVVVKDHNHSAVADLIESYFGMEES